MRVLGIDFECQSLDAQNTNVTEIGAVLVEVDHDPAIPLDLRFHRRLGEFSTLCYEAYYPAQSEEVLTVTGITDEELKELGKPLKESFSSLLEWVHQSDVILAHNKKYDETVYRATLNRLGLTPPEKEWVCSVHEVPYPKKFRCKQLSHLALDHGMKLDSREFHRAKDDVELMLDLVLGHYDFPDVLAYSKEPWRYLIADITAPWNDGGKQKGEATRLGFSWEVPRAGPERKFEKKWVKATKERYWQEEMKQAPWIFLKE